MVSKETINKFVGKKVFIKIIGDKVQVGTLEKVGDDFLLRSKNGRTVIESSQIARITEEYR